MAILLVYNVPGHGHINPSLPLVADLARRGHRVTYFATPRYRAAIEACGAQFEAYRAIGDDYFDPFVVDGIVPMRVADALMTSTEEMLPALLEQARAMQPDAILFDGMCPWGYFLARIMRLPAVASISLMPPVPPGYLLQDRKLLAALLPLMAKSFGKGLRAVQRVRTLAAKYAVPPLAPAALLNAEGDLTISHTCPEFVPYAHLVPPSVRFTGWTLYEQPVHTAPLPRAEAGRPLVYVSLGTLNSNAPEFFRACIEAFAESGTSVLISTGGRVEPEALGPLPPGVEVRAWVPQAVVLRQASLFVTHGGMGSAHDGLYLGLPMLLVPQQQEQAYTAQRVETLGAGLMLRKSEATADALRARAARLLAEPHFAQAARRLGESLRALGGAARAADHVEALLASAPHATAPGGTV